MDSLPATNDSRVSHQSMVDQLASRCPRLLVNETPQAIDPDDLRVGQNRPTCNTDIPDRRNPSPRTA